MPSTPDGDTLAWSHMRDNMSPYGHLWVRELDHVDQENLELFSADGDKPWGASICGVILGDQAHRGSRTGQKICHDCLQIDYERLCTEENRRQNRALLNYGVPPLSPKSQSMLDLAIRTIREEDGKRTVEVTAPMPDVSKWAAQAQFYMHSVEGPESSVDYMVRQSRAAKPIANIMFDGNGHAWRFLDPDKPDQPTWTEKQMQLVEELKGIVSGDLPTGEWGDDIIIRNRVELLCQDAPIRVPVPPNPNRISMGIDGLPGLG